MPTTPSQLSIEEVVRIETFIRSNFNTCWCMNMAIDKDKTKRFLALYEAHLKEKQILFDMLKLMSDYVNEPEESKGIYG